MKKKREEARNHPHSWSLLAFSPSCTCPFLFTSLSAYCLPVYLLSVFLTALCPSIYFTFVLFIYSLPRAPFIPFYVSLLVSLYPLPTYYLSTCCGYHYLPLFLPTYLPNTISLRIFLISYLPSVFPPISCFLSMSLSRHLPPIFPRTSESTYLAPAFLSSSLSTKTSQWREHPNNSLYEEVILDFLGGKLVHCERSAKIFVFLKVLCFRLHFITQKKKEREREAR